MTDPIDYDALLSRVLDGEATPEERARVAADGSLSARLDLLRRTQALVAEDPPPLAAATVDQLVARALREAPVAAAPPASAPPPDGAADAAPELAPVPPASLDAHRGRRRRLPLVLTAAAAVLVLLVAVPVLALTLGGGDDDDTSADQAQEQAGSAGVAEDAAEAPTDFAANAGDVDEAAALLQRAEPLDAMELSQSDGGAPTTTAPTPQVDDEAVAEAVVPPPEGADIVTWCRSQQVRAFPELGGDDVRGDTMTFQGDVAVAYLYEADGDDVVLVLSAATCDVLEGPSPT